ncbi:MAG: reverse transcriptase family protein [Haliea sp.]
MTLRKRKKLRINTKNKHYAIDQCHLYKCCSKKKLLELLGLDACNLKEILNDQHRYRVFHRFDPLKNKTREIQEPQQRLGVVHNRIASLLSRVAQPDYVHSGIKGRSNISNAAAHQYSDKVVTMDIETFFPSTTRSQIEDFFFNNLLCSPDVAKILATLCSFDDHLPTGSQLSMPLAFWANANMFNELNFAAQKKGILMTLYVDDVTFSGRSADKGFSSNASLIVARNGHRVNPRKTRHYTKTQPKLITGVIVDNGQLKVRNMHHKRIHETYVEFRNGSDTDRVVLKTSLKGRMNAAAGIDPKFKTWAKTIS